MPCVIGTGVSTNKNIYVGGGRARESVRERERVRERDCESKTCEREGEYFFVLSGHVYLHSL